MIPEVLSSCLFMFFVTWFGEGPGCTIFSPAPKGRNISAGAPLCQRFCYLSRGPVGADLVHKQVNSGDKEREAAGAEAT